MNTQESKDRIIGLLASILLHILFFALGYLLLHKQDGNKPPKVERKVLSLNQFTKEPQEKSAPVRESKPSKPTPPTPTKKTVQQKQSPIQKTITPKKTEPIERNKTAATRVAAPSKPSGSALLSELNSEFKTMKKEVGGPIKKLYGEEFERLGKEEQKFIKDNLGSIGRITEKYLRYPDTAGRLGQQGTSVVEFYLHPNGDISDMRLLSSSGFRMLDKNSIETIEIAYKDYPRPTTKTKIRMFVGYSIY